MRDRTNLGGETQRERGSRACERGALEARDSGTSKDSDKGNSNAANETLDGEVDYFAGSR